MLLGCAQNVIGRQGFSSIGKGLLEDEDKVGQGTCRHMERAIIGAVNEEYEVAYSVRLRPPTTMSVKARRFISSEAHHEREGCSAAVGAA